LYFFHLKDNISDGQAARNKVTFSTTLGLVVHAAGFNFEYFILLS